MTVKTFFAFLNTELVSHQTVIAVLIGVSVVSIGLIVYHHWAAKKKDK